MRRLSVIFLFTVAMLVVIVALLVSSLRLILPHLDCWRPQVLAKIEAAIGLPIEASQLSAQWQKFGPALDVRDIDTKLKDGGHLRIKRIILELNVWQSLLHMRWQFHNLAFYQLQLWTTTPLSNDEWQAGIENSHIINDVLMHQFKHVNLRDSEISFITFAGQRAKLTIPQLIWFNGRGRHCAEGLVRLSSLNVQHGAMQMRIGLRDDNGLKGRVWFQADDVDVKPWLGERWMQNNCALQTARFSLESWLSFENGNIARGDVWLKQVGISWQGEQQQYDLSVDNLTVHIVREGERWQLSIHNTSITMNDKPWLRGLLTMAWGTGQNARVVGKEDSSQAWRFPSTKLIGKELVDSLSCAIQGGQADNATPHLLFPYKHNGGQFQLLVPLRNTTFAFQPDWPTLKNFDVELNFFKNGLWLKANSIALGGVTASNLTAVIPDFSKGKLLIDANIHGSGNVIKRYLKKTPLEDSLASVLDELQIDGDVNASLHLNVPLDGKMMTVKGEVRLNDNSLYIKSIDSTLKNLSGQFSFVNGNLKSELLRATWFNQPINLDFSTNKDAKAYQIAVNMTASWQLARMNVLPKSVGEAISGGATWKGKVAINLSDHANYYNIEITGDLKNLISHLPYPLNKNAGEALPVKISVDGTSNSFLLMGSAGKNHHFNSRWLLQHNLTLERAIWTADSRSVPPLPELAGLELNLPPMDSRQWLGLFQRHTRLKSVGANIDQNVQLPQTFTLRTPALMLGRQRWNDLSIVYKPIVNDGSQVEVQGREINGTLTMRDNAPWQAVLHYFYYNPSTASVAMELDLPSFASTLRIDFSGWPDLQLRCAECWLLGKKYGRIDGNFTIKGNTLALSGGLIDTGFSKFTADGEWVNCSSKERTSLQGRFYGKKLDAVTDLFGVTMPICGAAFDIHYDFYWLKPPWQLDRASLNGSLETHFGKGAIAQFSTGHVGQLLRLLSFDALLRKLQFDFSDILNKGFYFDSIRSVAWIKNGIMYTDDTLVDGLEIDIAMKGTINLVCRNLDMEADVTPEIATTVGVATAFAVNPIVGAAVFAASKVLGPLWNKFSIIHYHIIGPIDQQQINKVPR